jgi:uncharacterized protein (TIGR02246 family)
MKAFRTSLLLTVLSLLACQASGPSGLTQADRDAIAEISTAFLEAARGQDWTALAATYTEDAILMPPNQHAVQGRTAIQAFFENFPPMSDMTLENVEVEGVGDMAYIRGIYSMTINMDGVEPMVDTGKYLEVRKKQADGSWLLHRDMFSSDIAMEH